MKLKGLKYYILGLIGGLILLPGFSNAVNTLNSVGIGENLGSNNYCLIDSNLSFQCSESDNILISQDSDTSVSYFWLNNGLGIYQYSSDSLFYGQGIMTGFQFCDIDYYSLGHIGTWDWESSCLGQIYSYSEFKDYASSHELKGWGFLTNVGWVNGFGGPVFVFENGAFRATVDSYNGNLQVRYGTYYTHDFGLTGFSLQADYSNLNIVSAPIRGPTTFYYSTGSCPSVGQLKSSSGLTPNVCYGGYGSNVLYSDQVVFQGGTGLNLFELYNLYSGGMELQTWYDTYWGYYQNISRDSRPFEGHKKALLGLFFARQTFGNTAGTYGSYKILNYCYYVLNNISDNSSTCVVPGVSTAYPGVIITDQDKQDIVDAVNDNYVVHRPGSGSIFLSGGLGGGGSSRGGEDCKGIPCLFDNFYQMFTSSRINNVDFSAGGSGILPYYISLAFVIVVLYYVFKR